MFAISLNNSDDEKIQELYDRAIVTGEDLTPDEIIYLIELFDGKVDVGRTLTPTIVDFYKAIHSCICFGTWKVLPAMFRDLIPEDENYYSDSERPKVVGQLQKEVQSMYSNCPANFPANIETARSTALYWVTNSGNGYRDLLVAAHIFVESI